MTAIVNTGFVDLSRQFPTAWRRVPFWATYRRVKVLASGNEELLSVYRDYGVIKKSDRDDNFNRPSDDLTTYQVVRPGDLVINKMKAWQGSVAISQLDGIVSPAYFVFHTSDTNVPRFMHYLLRSDPYIAAYRAGSKGIRPNQWDLDPEILRTFPLPIPTVAEQQSIVSFLERETAEIDAFIADQEELIGLLAERRAATISHAVTKGLDPTVPMNDSGIEWLARMPRHWVLEKASRLFVARKGLRAAMLTQEYAHDHPGDYPVYSGQTSDGGVLGMIDTFELAAGNQGQLLVTTVGAKAMFLRHIFGEFSLSQNCMTVSSIDKSVATRFYFYLFQTLFGFEKRRIPQHMQASFRMEDFYQYRLPLPPPDEQKAISGHLDAASAEIDASIVDARAAIALSRERRAALISAAVTGKIDVRGAAQ